jgi:hypothetical protein
MPRSVRLRISCDLKYPQLIDKIIRSLQRLLPRNKVSTFRRIRRCVDVICYSNHWETLLGWRAAMGSKADQSVSVPSWIRQANQYKVHCLRGLMETDGCIYIDRGYPMVMFTATIPELARDVYEMILSLRFKPHMYAIKRDPPRRTIYQVRLSKRVPEFLALIRPDKS